VAAVRDDRHRAAEPGHRGGDLGGDARPAHARDDHGTWPAVRGHGTEQLVVDVQDGLAHLGAGGRDGPQHLAGVQQLQRLAVVEDAVVHQRPAGHKGRRASSISSTGMSSRTG
jgi:hypothetical protein